MPICSNCKVTINKITKGVVIYYDGYPISLPEGHVLECHNNQMYVARRLITSGKQVEGILQDPTLSYIDKQKIIRQKTEIDHRFEVRLEPVAVEAVYDKEFVGSPYKAKEAGWQRREDFTWLCPECVVNSGNGNTPS